jgi:hypothetical protein
MEVVCLGLDGSLDSALQKSEMSHRFRLLFVLDPFWIRQDLFLEVGKSIV